MAATSAMSSTSKLLIATLVSAAALLTAPSTSLAQSCELLFNPEGPSRNEVVIPFYRMNATIAGVERKVTFVRPEDFERYQRLVQKENPVQLMYKGDKTGTVAEKEATLMTKFLGRVARAVINGIARKDVTRSFIRVENQGPVLTSTRILEIRSELLTKAGGDLAKVRNFWVQIGDAPLMDGAVFLELAKEAEASPFARVELSQMVNSTGSGKAANFFYSAQRLLMRYGWRAFVFSWPLAKLVGIETDATMDVGMLFMASSAAGSIIGSVGSAHSDKLAYVLPNFAALIDNKNATALALNAAKNGAQTIQALAEMDPNVRDILIVTDVETFRIELRKRLGDTSAAH